MTSQTTQSILAKPDQNAREISDAKDSVVAPHKHQNSHFMSSGLLSCQLSQRLSGKLYNVSDLVKEEVNFEMLILLQSQQCLGNLYSTSCQC